VVRDNSAVYNAESGATRLRNRWNSKIAAGHLQWLAMIEHRLRGELSLGDDVEVQQGFELAAPYDHAG
jgi:hypothetical protein